MTPEDYLIRLEHGKKVLTAYHNKENIQPESVYEVEKYFGFSSASVCRLGDVCLVGKIDRIDLLDNKKKTGLIVDYKTGKTKTRGEIEGTTKTSTGYLKRQLVFYALLAKLDKHFPLKITQFELDFVENPYLKNKSGRVIFTISEEEIANLKKTIKKAMKKIRSLDFPKTKDISICQHCEFKNHCWPD